MKEEKDKKLEEEEIKASKRNSNQSELKDNKKNKLPLIDYDKYRKMDSNFFNKSASKIESTFSNNNFNNSLNEESFDIISLKNSVNQSMNLSNLGDNNSNFGQNNDIVMKKIVLLKPEVKLNKEERSIISINGSVNCIIILFKIALKLEDKSNKGKIILDSKSKTSFNEKKVQFKTPIEKISLKEKEPIRNNQMNNSNLQRINTEGNSEFSKNINQDKNEGLKGIHLNQEEKDSFIGVLGFLQNNLNYLRQYKLISVESFYGIFNFS